MNRAIGLLAAGLCLSAGARAGDLDPSSAPMPTMVTLEELNASSRDPRTSILPDGTSTFVIGAPGSYVLAGNVTMTAAATAIRIEASQVTLDLNGFTLAGAGSGSAGFGVDQASGTSAVVRNGFVRDCGDGGIRLGDGGRVSDVSVETSGGPGISVGSGSRATDCVVVSNSGAGIVADAECVVGGCESRSNGGDGIMAGAGCVVVNNLVRVNEGDGIEAEGGCSIRENQVTTAKEMDTVAIRLLTGFSRVDGNAITSALVGVDASVSTQDLVVRNSFADVDAVDPIALGTLTRAGIVLTGLSGNFTASEPWANFKLDN